MSIPLRSLPVIQNFSCHSCSDCCRIEAEITDEEKQRIEALNLADDPAVAPQPWFLPVGWQGKTWTLKHRPDGSCVFLTTSKRCRLQERFGAEAKPLVCRLFPFVLVPAGDHWRMGVRFSCPSVAANQGRPITEAEKDLARLSRLLERHTGRSVASAPPPLMQAGEQLSWPDVSRLVQALLEIVQDRSDRLERRIRKCLAMAHVCSQAKLDGITLSEHLRTVRQAVELDVPRTAAEMPPPDWLLGRVLFRTLLAIFGRRDRDKKDACGVWSRLGRIRAGWRFVRGRGSVPRINEFLPEIRFEDVDQAVAMPAEWDETLERYYVVKLSSLQFCGPPNFDLPFWAGLESLALTLPMILWLNRAIVGSAPAQALQLAIQLVDDHFGADPMLNLPHFRFMQRTLAEHGELAKLVAWYGR